MNIALPPPWFKTSKEDHNRNLKEAHRVKCKTWTIKLEGKRSHKRESSGLEPRKEFSDLTPKA